MKRVLKVLFQLVKVEGLLGVCRLFFDPRVCHWLSNLRYFLRCHSNFKYRDDRTLSRARQFSAEQNLSDWRVWLTYLVTLSMEGVLSLLPRISTLALCHSSPRSDLDSFLTSKTGFGGTLRGFAKLEN